MKLARNGCIDGTTAARAGIAARDRNVAAALLAAAVALGAAGAAQGDAIALSGSGGSVSQNFDSLPNTGTTNGWANDATLSGWFAIQSNGTGPTAIRAGDGSSNAGGLYSFGTVGDTDRALGDIGSGTPGGFGVGAEFVNNTGATVNAITISYTGEQWRDGGNTSVAAQTAVFSYMIGGSTFTPPNPSSSSAGTVPAGWTAFSALDFTSPTHSNTAGVALNGNDPANETQFDAITLTGVTLAPGQTFWIRWDDGNDVGNDHALAVDKFSLAFTTAGGGGMPNYLDSNGAAAGIGVADGGTTVWDTTTTNWTGVADGTGTPAVFAAGQTTIFGGTAGTVAVASVNPSGGLEFDSGGYVLNGGQITLNSVATVTVTSAGDVATINSQISGSVGLTKTGQGALVLGSTANDFVGTVTIGGGVLSISDDRNLGDAGNAIFLAGGKLQATASINTARGISGSGTLDIAPGTTFLSSGAVNMSALNLSNSGKLDLEGTSPTAGTITFTGAGTVTSSGAITVAGLNAGNLAGIATVSPAGGLNLGSGTKAVNVGTGGTLVLATAVNLGGSGSNSLQKLGSGTLELDGDNGGLIRVQIGSTSATSPIDGGTVKISNNTALGTSQLFLNVGTLEATTDLDSENGLAIGVSIGGLDNGPAILSGGNMDFNGDSDLFPTTGHFNQLTVNNITTLNGAMVAGGSTGFTLNGTGKLVINGDASGMAVATRVSGATLVVNSTWGGPLTLADGAKLGGSGTITDIVTAGATLHTIAPSAGLTANSATTLTMAGLVTNTSTTLAFNLGTPFNATTGAASVNDKIMVTGALDVSGGGTVAISNSSEGTASLGYYKVMGYSTLTLPASPGPNLGFTMPAVVNGITYVLDTAHDPGFIDIHRGFLGDANDDGIVNAIDLGILATNFNSTSGNWSLGDYNDDGVVNAIDLGILATNFNGAVGGGSFEEDLQAFPELEAVFFGGGSSAVPEPASLALLGAGAAALLGRRRRNG